MTENGVAPDVVLVFDLGTSSVKVAAYTESGARIVHATRSYAIDTPRPGWAEQDADTWWDACVAAGREVTDQLARPPIGVTACNQQVTTVPLDEQLQPLAPAMLWMDTRTSEIASRIRETIGTSVLETVGMPVSTSWAALRVAWWLEHAPEMSRRTRWFSTADAFLYGRLTGRVVSDESNACFGPFDLAARNWSDTVAAKIGIDTATLPEVVPPGTCLGPLLDAVARQLGVPAGTPVFAGASDQPSSAIGLGVVDPSLASATIGTGTFVVVPATSPVADPRYMVNCSGVPGQWIRYGLHYLSSALVDWWSGLVGSSAEELASEAAATAPGADGLTVLPYFQGARTPHFDDSARGVFFGLTLSHDRAAIARAIFESNAHGIREALDAMSPDDDLDEIRLAGGGSNHPFIPQLVADVTRRTVRTTLNAESSSLGAAMLAWTGLGAHPDLDTAAQRSVELKATFSPDPTVSALHEHRHETYRELYSRVQPMFDSSTR